MASGMYPVVADTPGVRDWIHPKNGSLFDPRDKQALYDKINNLINKHPNIDAILKLNYEKVIEKGNFEENIRRTIRAMEELLKNAG